MGEGITGTGTVGGQASGKGGEATGTQTIWYYDVFCDGSLQQ